MLVCTSIYAYNSAANEGLYLPPVPYSTFFFFGGLLFIDLMILPPQLENRPYVTVKLLLITARQIFKFYRLPEGRIVHSGFRHTSMANNLCQALILTSEAYVLKKKQNTSLS